MLVKCAHCKNYLVVPDEEIENEYTTEFFCNFDEYSRWAAKNVRFVNEHLEYAYIVYGDDSDNN